MTPEQKQATLDYLWGKLKERNPEIEKQGITKGDVVIGFTAENGEPCVFLRIRYRDEDHYLREHWESFGLRLWDEDLWGKDEYDEYLFPETEEGGI